MADTDKIKISELAEQTDAVNADVMVIDNGTATNKISILNLFKNLQQKLVSGTNIKTINNESILGNGNISISGGTGKVDEEVIDEDYITTITREQTSSNTDAIDIKSVYTDDSIRGTAESETNICSNEDGANVVTTSTFNRKIDLVQTIGSAESNISDSGINLAYEYTYITKDNEYGGTSALAISENETNLTYNATDENGDEYSSSISISQTGISLEGDVNSSSKITAPEIDAGIIYQTSAPTANNTNGLKIAVLSSEPSTKYNGWLYLIESED